MSKVSKFNNTFYGHKFRRSTRLKNKSYVVKLLMKNITLYFL